MPFTRSYAGRHCKDWPRPPSRHTFLRTLWTLHCNPHTRCPRGTPLLHLINSGCSSLLSDLGDVWTAEAGQEFCLSTFNCFLQTGQEGLWAWGPLWSENHSGWRLLGEQCRQEDQAGAWPFECCTQRATNARQMLLACWRLSVEADGGQGGKATLRADTWRSFRSSPRHHSHQRCRVLPAKASGAKSEQVTGHQEGLRAGAAALHCLCFPSCPRAFTPSAFAHVSPGFARQLAMRKPVQLSNLSAGQSLEEEETAPGRARAGRESSRDNCQDETSGTGQGPVRFLIPGVGTASSCPPASVGLANQQDRNELWCFPV